MTRRFIICEAGVYPGWKIFKRNTPQKIASLNKAVSLLLPHNVQITQTQTTEEHGFLPPLSHKRRHVHAAVSRPLSWSISSSCRFNYQIKHLEKFSKENSPKVIFLFIAFDQSNSQLYYLRITQALTPTPTASLSICTCSASLLFINAIYGVSSFLYWNFIVRRFKCGLYKSRKRLSNFLYYKVIITFLQECQQAMFFP